MSEETVVTAPKTNPNYLNGVFYFSNASDEDFVAMWNSFEYIFPAKTCSPMLIPGETPEAIQEIRKRFALKWAVDQWHKGKEYKKMDKAGGRVPAIPDNKVYDPYILMCLSPLPIEKAKVREAKKEGEKYSGKSKPVKRADNLNEVFKDVAPEELGEMSI